jgi:hypothetical protein
LMPPINWGFSPWGNLGLGKHNCPFPEDEES